MWFINLAREDVNRLVTKLLVMSVSKKKCKKVTVFQSLEVAGCYKSSLHACLHDLTHAKAPYVAFFKSNNLQNNVPWAPFHTSCATRWSLCVKNGHLMSKSANI